MRLSRQILQGSCNSTFSPGFNVARISKALVEAHHLFDIIPGRNLYRLFLLLFHEVKRGWIPQTVLLPWCHHGEVTAFPSCHLSRSTSPAKIRIELPLPVTCSLARLIAPEALLHASKSCQSHFGNLAARCCLKKSSEIVGYTKSGPTAFALYQVRWILSAFRSL